MHLVLFLNFQDGLRRRPPDPGRGRQDDSANGPAGDKRLNTSNKICFVFTLDRKSKIHF